MKEFFMLIITITILCNFSMAGSKTDNNNKIQTEIKGEFETWLSPWVSNLIDVSGSPGKATGLVIAVSSPHIRQAFSYGVTKVGGERTQETTIFEIGSITKVYTGLMLGLALEEGKASLERSINSFFPLGAPRLNGRSITFLDLATHYSGLPNYDPSYRSEVPYNPAANYQEKDLVACMSGDCSLQYVPGKVAKYSNLGSGILGHILTKIDNKVDYEELLKQKIILQLNLSDTSTHLSSLQSVRKAQGYSSGVAAPEIQIGAPLIAAGGIKSTALDVLNFLESSFQSSSSTLKAAWERVLKPQRLIAKPQTMIGLLVAIENFDGITLYSKAGETPGFSSFIVFSKSPDIAVVIVSNSHNLKLKDFAYKIHKRLKEGLRNSKL